MKPTTPLLALCLLFVIACSKNNDTIVQQSPATTVNTITGSYRCNARHFTMFTGQRPYYDSTSGQMNVKWVTDSSTTWSIDTVLITQTSDSTIRLGNGSTSAKLLAANHYTGWDAYTYHYTSWDVYYYPAQDSIYYKTVGEWGPGNNHNSYIDEYFGIKIK